MTERINQKTVDHVGIIGRRNYVEIVTGLSSKIPSDVILVEVNKIDEVCNKLQAIKQQILKSLK